MSSTLPRRMLLLVLALAVPAAWFSMRFDPYAIDGDAVGYMDIADLIHAHRWAGVVNGYWHPLYPAVLLLAQQIFHATRATELDAYYKINFVLFLLQIVAVLCFATALVRLRTRLMAMPGSPSQSRPEAASGVQPGTAYLLHGDGIRLLGVGLLIIASQRELTMGKVRPDGLLQALILFGFSAMLAVVERTGMRARLGWSALMGLSFGLAYLTKSFAFLLALLAVAAMVLFQVRWQKRGAARSLLSGAVALLVFALVAGPYTAALSHQKHRLDFGDSGSLNYAWYVGGTQKFHLEPWQTDRFGSSTVTLLHPEQQLLARPGIYSYRALPYGTIPPWFDATWFNDRIVTHIHAGQLLHRDVRNVVLVFRYLLNHPEAWLLLALLLACGARLRTPWARPGNAFWLLPAGLGVAIWAIYGLVNVEERYVTVGYLAIVLPVFAALRADSGRAAGRDPAASAPARGGLHSSAVIAVALLAFLPLGESVRIAAEQRRQQSIRGIAHGWQATPLLAVAQGLQAMGVQPGQEIACAGSIACVNDPYWMRAAGVRTLTEIFFDDDHLTEDLSALPNRQQVYSVVRGNGATVLVGHFDPGHLAGSPLAGEGWQRLQDTDYFALTLRAQRAPERAQ